MPKAKAIALKPPTITRLQGKSWFGLGPPPVPGKALTIGKSVAVSVLVQAGVAVK